MNKYKVYDKNNPATFPKENEHLLIWDESNRNPFIGKFNGKYFLDSNSNPLSISDCFYAYIGNRPTIKDVKTPLKCGKCDRNCEFYDDGYCFHCPFYCIFAYRSVEYEVED